MVLGVPLTPFFVVFSVIVLVSIYTTILCILILPVAIFGMRMVTKHDDQQFRLLGLKGQCRVQYFLGGNARFWQCSAYAPVCFARRK